MIVSGALKKELLLLLLLLLLCLLLLLLLLLWIALRRDERIRLEKVTQKIVLKTSSFCKKIKQKIIRKK